MDRRDFLKIMGTTCAASVLAGLAPGCFRSSAPSPRLVLLYAPCTVNKNCLSPFNSQVDYTPHLQDFADQAAVLENCQTEAGATGIAYAAMFSGCQADRHGVFSQPSVVPDQVPLITETFAQNGFDVFFWGAHGMANYDLNYAQGVRPQNAFAQYLEAHHRRFETILDRLASDDSYRVLIITNFTVTHNPYCPVFPPYTDFMPYQDRRVLRLQHLPGEYDRLALTPETIKKYNHLYQTYHWALDTNFEAVCRHLALTEKEKQRFIDVITYTYQVNIARLDRLFGHLIKAIKHRDLFQKSLIVFTADHGELLYRDNDYRAFTHGGLMPEVLAVPLMISWPQGGLKPARYPELVRSIDIFPTLADLCGLTGMPATTGRSLAAGITAQTALPELAAYSHTSVLSDIFVKMSRQEIQRLAPIVGTAQEEKWLAATQNGRKMQVAVKHQDRVFKYGLLNIDQTEFRPALFDHGQDPEERRNLFDPENRQHQRVLHDLKQYQQNLALAYNQRHSRGAGPSLDRQEKIKRLRSLGYI